MESAGPLGRMLLAGSVDLFDLLPAPVLLVELSSGRILFANAAAQALAGGEYPPGLAERVARGERIAADELDAGMSFVNQNVRSDSRLPFGGVKHSGYGRECSHFGIREFVNIKSVWIR